MPFQNKTKYFKAGTT